jgi:hypothetical protein
MVVNFKTREISQGVCKLARTSTLIKKLFFFFVQIKDKKIRGYEKF